MYFNNNWSANCWLTKPLMVIPLEYIKLVQRVSVNTEPKKSKKSEHMHQFEIFLMEDVNIFKLNSSPFFKKNRQGKKKVHKRQEEKKEVLNSSFNKDEDSEYGINFKSKEEEEDYKKFAEEYSSELKSIRRTEEICIKHISAWLPSLSSTHLPTIDQYTWTHREAELNSAKERFLFATDAEEACAKWIIVLNWLLNKSS
eukprot:TRINITY_DN17216_c0_g1_i1.p1 TRINITY_DN17216_c0_g1~~TRINITY_DN17216_c0_g1_i1.p1  ORF type:complete len:199 (-),score=47.28 TRINITY_DN17216_c0_g1_i1:57-653(-)